MLSINSMSADRSGPFVQTHHGDAPGHSSGPSIPVLGLGSCVLDVSDGICPPSDEEFRLAIEAGAAALKAQPDVVSRGLLMQQDVLLRYFHCNGQRSSGSRSMFSLSATTSSGSSCACSCHSSSSADSVVAAADAGAPVVNGVIPGNPPALKVFRCPVCPDSSALLNERDFGRHVDSWLKRCDRVGCKKLRRNQCPGVPDDHPFLSDYEGSHRERVRILHAAVRSRMHPGCIAGSSAQGSGNHLAVEAFIRSLPH